MDVVGGENGMSEGMGDMEKFNHQNNLTIDVNRSASFNNDEASNSPTMFGETDSEKQVTTSPRVMRAACDFCHAKRIKCRRDESEPEGGRCLQCIRRNIKCNFSYKEKTGPKPKILRQNKDSERGKVSLKNDDRNKQSFVTLEANNLSQGSPYSMGNKPSPKMASYEQNSMDSDGQINTPTSTEDQLHQEKIFLRSYLTTVAKLLPFCPEEQLLEAFSQKERSPVPNAVPSTVAQAQLAGALAIGALIRNSRVAESYHYAARSHLKSLFSSPSPEAGRVLCMLAFYWQYKGDEEKKTVYLRHAKLGLDRAPNSLTLELRLCMEHLDYENVVKSTSINQSLAPRLRALHLVSCVLSDIQELMDPVEGYYSASSYAAQLNECSSSLDLSAGEALPALLCASLHSFLLVMLGRREDAENVLKKVPSFLESCPDAPRALPLSWDSSLIVATLAFILQLRPSYAAIYSAVKYSQNATAATQWTCQLPSVDQTPNDYLDHRCRSTSNICSIICQVGRTTKCGKECFYSDYSSVQEAEGGNNVPLAPLSVPQLPKELEQQVLARQQQANLKKQLQKQYHPKASYAAAHQNNQRRTHYEMSGNNNALNDMMPENAFRAPLLNSNQASPVPYTQKRIRNSCTNTPTGSLSPALGTRNIEVPQKTISNFKKLSPSHSESPNSTSGKYAFEYMPKTKDAGPILTELMQGMENYVKNEPRVKKEAMESELPSSSWACSSGMSTQKNDQQSCTNNSPGYFDMFSGMGFSANSFLKNSSLGAINPFEMKHENSLESSTGNGLLSALGLNDDQLSYQLPNSFPGEGAGLNRDDSGYFALMDDQDLMGVLQDWSMGSESVEKDILVGLKDKKQNSSSDPTEGEVRSNNNHQTPALQA